MTTRKLILGAVALGAIGAIGYVLYASSQKKLTAAPVATPAAPDGTMWGEMLPQSGTVFTFVPGAYLIEADSSASAASNLATYLQTQGFTIVSSWPSGQLPSGWPGSADPKKLRFYVVLNTGNPDVSIDGIGISGFGAYATTPKL